MCVVCVKMPVWDLVSNKLVQFVEIAYHDGRQWWREFGDPLEEVKIDDVESCLHEYSSQNRQRNVLGYTPQANNNSQQHHRMDCTSKPTAQKWTSSVRKPSIHKFSLSGCLLLNIEHKVQIGTCPRPWHSNCTIPRCASWSYVYDRPHCGSCRWDPTKYTWHCVSQSLQSCNEIRQTRAIVSQSWAMSIPARSSLDPSHDKYWSSNQPRGMSEGCRSHPE